ncbi:hypothetical protein KKA24_02450 [Patescibacteria group bacterium]|nr:hypothetical protein [Patescibacteria group bacterium]
MKNKNQWRVYDIYSGKFKYLESKNIQHRMLDKLDRFGVKSGLTILISVLMVYGVVQAGTITAPSGTPSAKFYTLTEIYNFINSNTTATEGGHSFTFTDDLAGGGYTLTQIYNSLTGLISADKVKLGTTYLNTAGTLVPSGGDAGVANVLSGKTFFGASQTTWDLQTGTMANNGSFALSSGASDQAVTEGYYSGGTLTGDADLISANILSGKNIFGVDGDGNVVNTSSGDAVAGNLLSGKIAWVAGSEITGTMPTQTLSTANDTVSAGYYAATTLSAVDTDLISANILSGKTIFGVDGSLTAGYAYGSADASQVLTSAGAGAGTYNATNLTVGNVRYGQSFGVSSTGTASPYPNTPSGIDGLNQTACTAASWTWVADSNYDGVNDDPICVNPSREVGNKVWSTSVGNDTTFIGNYSCSDSEANLETFDAQLNGLVVENASYGDDAATALAITDCKDGIRNLLSKAEVEAFGYTAPDTDCTPTTDDCYNGPLTPKALVEWKGTRLPSHNDFYGVCGNGTTSTTYGNYGNQIGRADNVITANAGSWEWLSEQYYYNSARVAGFDGCSYFRFYYVTLSYGVRAVFRP